MDGSPHHYTDDLAEFASICDSEKSPAARGKRRRTLPPELQTYPFSLRLTPAEREVVVNVARLAGSRAPATWARRALLELARELLARVGREGPHGRSDR